MCKHMRSLGIPLQTYTLPWLMCLFTTGTPAETTLQVWDLMLLGSAPHRVSSQSQSQSQSQDQDQTNEGQDGSRGSSSGGGGGGGGEEGATHGGGRPTTDDKHGGSDDGRRARARSRSSSSSSVPTSPTAAGGRRRGTSDSTTALTQSDCALNILLLLVVAMFTMLAKDILQAKDPQSLTGLIKRLARCNYDCNQLLTTAVEVAGKDRKSWSSEWSWHGLLASPNPRICSRTLVGCFVAFRRGDEAIHQ